MPKQIVIEIPEDIESIDKKIAQLLFELGLAIMRRDFHKKAEILAYFEARGWHI
jgi:methylase of polypeptide subunit release factors